MLILNTKEQQEALQIARTTIESYVKNGNIPSISPQLRFSQKHHGVFVTLRKKNGELRGCIGEFEPNRILSEVICELTISAAVRDPRFNPIRKEELKDILIEISILSPKRKIADWHEVMPGVHGVLLKKGEIMATFLPQVAIENHMSKEDFLSSLCQEKAGLPFDCYTDPTIELYVYETQIIEEF
jgi:AmmeMemoRadiSam system protein A